MDIRMPEMDGIEATRRIVARGRRPPARVLMLTTFDLDEYVYDALRAGASGFLLKDVPAEQLADGIRLVAQGEALLAPSATRRLIHEFARTAPARREAPPAIAELTPRELEVFRLIARGRSNAEIAAELFVGETTVKTHVTRILMKLGVRDRVQAVVLAYESGIVAPGEEEADHIRVRCGSRICGRCTRTGAGGRSPTYAWRPATGSSAGRSTARRRGARGSRASSRRSAPHVIGRDPRAFARVSSDLRALVRMSARRPGLAGGRRDRERMHRPGGQGRGRAGARALRRAGARPGAGVLVALRLVPRDARRGVRDAAAHRPRRLGGARARGARARVHRREDEPGAPRPGRARGS